MNSAIHTNKLILEASPYLLQHAHNPVNWYPWGEEALEKARIENKPLLISIGYSACHWCHVMERESFENDEVAEIMNENFICIKVDREERPDVDHLYMDAVQLMNQSGGWPLNVFALPDGRPFYGGTYFPKENWISVCQQIASLYANQNAKVQEYANNLLAGIKQSNLVETAKSELPDKEQMALISRKLLKGMDEKEGGLNGRNKFPMPSVLHFLLNYSILAKDPQAEKQLYLTLDKMAQGGIYDQLGGGFSRYATDPEWKVPHFEKMLYDNAQLISLYSFAYQHSKNELYKQVVYETIDFVKRELTSPEFAFFSSLDADSEGEEGKYYVWTKDEIEKALMDDAFIFCSYYGVGMKGLWEEDKNILLVDNTIDKISKENNLSSHEVALILQEGKEKLNIERSKRIRPGLDDKILTSWNALMLSALLDAYQVFDNEEYLSLATKNIDFILSNMLIDKQLFRVYKNEKHSIPGFLDDYSILVKALIKFYEVSFDKKYLDLAVKLTKHLIDNFHDTDTGFFLFSSKENHELVSSKIELSDNVIPSPNSIMAHNLSILGKVLDNPQFLALADKTMKGITAYSESQPAFHSNWNLLLMEYAYPSFEVVVSGKDAQKIMKQFNSVYLPNVLIVGSVQEQNDVALFENRFVKGKSLIYICRNNACELPVSEMDDAIKLIKY
ncbi:thioredoxin domain-containing protein [Bacteroidota bacterium]